MGFDPLAYAFGEKGSGYPGGRDLVSYLMGKAGGGAYHEFTGNPLEFDAKKAAALKSCIVTMEPIQPGSGDPSPENVRPISGRTGVNVYQTGKNLFPKLNSGTHNNVQCTVSEDGTITLNGLCTASGLISVSRYLPAGRYSLCDFAEGVFPDNANARTQVYVSGYVQTINNNADSGAIVRATLQRGNIVSFRVRVDNGHNYENCKVKPMLVLGEPTSMTYEPYIGTIYTTTFPTPPGTVYGGTLDVTAGKLTVDKAYLYVDGSVSVNNVSYHQNTGLYFTTVANPIRGINTTISEPHLLSSRFKTRNGVAVGQTYITGDGKILVAVLPDQTAATKEQATAWFADNPTQFVYDLAEPIVYDLTPQEITTLVGRNVMWTDCDNLSVEAKGKAVEITPAQQLNMLLGGRYINNGTPDDVSDREALNLILGGENR